MGCSVASGRSGGRDVGVPELKACTRRRSGSPGTLRAGPARANTRIVGRNGNGPEDFSAGPSSELAQLPGVHPEFTRHLDVRVRELMNPAELKPPASEREAARALGDERRREHCRGSKAEGVPSSGPRDDERRAIEEGPEQVVVARGDRSEAAALRMGEEAAGQRNQRSFLHQALRETASETPCQGCRSPGHRSACRTRQRAESTRRNR